MNNKFLIILILSIVTYTANFWGTSIYILDEAKNASCAMEMYQRHDVIVPTFNNELRTDKPPLHYYFMMVSYSIFGVNPFAARLFSVIAGILTVISVYFFTQRLVNAHVAFFSALAMVSSLQLAIQFHLAVPDPYLILLMTLSFFLFYEGYQLQRKKSMPIFYGVVGLAFLTKGLIAVVLPGLVILVFILIQRDFNWKFLAKLKIFPWAFLFLMVAIPWYVAVGLATDGAWLEGFFLKHNVQRFTSTMEGHGGFFLAPFIIVIAALIPFSLFIFQSIAHAWRGRYENPFILFCLIIALAIPGFFCFSQTILPSYPAPSLPFIAVLLGNYLYSIIAEGKKKSTLVSLILNLIISLAVPVAVYFALMNESIFKPIAFSMAWWFIVLPVGGLLALYYYTKSNIGYSLYTMAASWILVIVLFFYVCYPQVDRRNPVSLYLTNFDEIKTVAYYKALNPAFVFAFKKPVQRLETPEDVEAFVNKNPGGHIITYKKYIFELDSIQNLKVSFTQKDLFENPETVVLDVR
jgi:4-amino-4-deoxy-L-arabinose transferase-like glycosyltransferase